MRVFIKYSHKSKIKIYTSSKLNKNFNYRKYDYTSYMWDRNSGACFLCYKNYILTYKSYYKNDKLHRLGGMAIADYKQKNIEYWIDGKRYKSEFEYWIVVGNYKNNI